MAKPFATSLGLVPLILALAARGLYATASADDTCSRGKACAPGKDGTTQSPILLQSQARLEGKARVAGTDEDAMPLHTFAHFKAKFGRSYEEGSDEHLMREAIFAKKVDELLSHNAKGLSWTLGVNHFTDRSEDELKMSRGYKRWHRPETKGVALLEVASNGSACVAHTNSCAESTSVCCHGLVCGAHGRCQEVPTLPTEKDWSQELRTMSTVLDQGACGSCWAVAATATIQMQAEILSNNRFGKILSPQTLLACTPNKMECGGQGGCQGATAELAYEWVKTQGLKGGVHTMHDLPYTASASTCIDKSSPDFPGPAVSITGWRQLPENTVVDVMNALITAGPLASSLAASALHAYSSGVIAECSDLTIDHAILLVGYGDDQLHGMKYWKIRNSWGSYWGEDGYFRIQRHSPDREEPCGWDLEPDQGVACKDKQGPEGKYPARTYVCGVCGILGDTSYPVGTTVPEELLD